MVQFKGVKVQLGERSDGRKAVIISVWFPDGTLGFISSTPTTFGSVEAIVSGSLQEAEKAWEAKQEAKVPAVS